MSAGNVDEGDNDKQYSDHLDTCDRAITRAKELFSPLPLASGRAYFIGVLEADVSDA